MQLRNTQTKYGIITKCLHWVVLLLVANQYFLMYRKDYFPKNDPQILQYILLHKSFGITLFVLGLLFVIWRFMNKKPSYPSLMHRWEKVLAKTVQTLLYLIIIIMPLSGLIMSQASGKPTAWFGHIMPTIFPTNKLLASIAYTTHIYLSNIALGIVILHVLGALKHLLTPNDNVMRRMMA